MVALQTEIEKLRTELLELDSQAKEAEAKYKEYHTKYLDYESVLKDLDRSRRDQARLQEEQNELGQSLEWREESDEWLQTEIDQYAERMRTRSEQRAKQSEIYNNLKQKLEAARANLGSQQGEAGEWKKEKTNHEQEIEERKKMIKTAARIHNIHGFEVDLDETRSREFTTRLSKLYKDQTVSVERARRETEGQLQTIRDAVTKLGERRSALNEGRQSAKQQLSQNDVKIVEWQSSIDSIAIDEGGKALLESTIQEVNGRLEKAKTEWNAESLDKKLQEANTQVCSIEEENEQLSREMARGTEKAQERARLDHLHQETDDNQKSLDTMCRVHGPRIHTVVGADWTPSSLGSKYQKIIEEKMEIVENAKAQKSGVVQRLDQVQYRLSSTRSDLKKGEQEQESCASHIRSSFVDETEPGDYPKALETVQGNRDTMKSDLDNVTYEKDYFRRCLKALNNRHICKTCDRPINKPEEKEKFERKINKILATEEEEYHNSFQQHEKELHQARNAGSSYATWLRLSGTEIPQLGRKIKELEKERDDLLTQIEEHDRVVDDSEESLKAAQSLSKTINGISKYVEDIARLRAQREELAGQQEDTSTSRAPKELQREMEVRNEKSRCLRNHMAKMTAQREAAQSHISTLERELNQSNMKLVTANSQLENNARVEKQIGQTRSQNREHRETIRRIDEQLKEIGPQITEEEVKMEDIKERGLKKERDLQQHASRLSDSVHQLSHLTQKIEAYTSGGGPEKLAKSLREVETTQLEINQVEDEQRQISKEINRLGQELGNQETNKRKIEDNIKYRKRQRELEKTNSDVARLSAQNAEADLDRHKRQADYWGRQHQLHSSAKTRQVGVMTEKDRACQVLIQEWETECQDAGRRYREAHIKVEVSLSLVSGREHTLTDPDD